MKTLLTLAIVSVTLNVLGADPLAQKLQQGLFEEEANHNLPAAIKSYEAVVALGDDQRRVVATAIFRLGECYRKLGKTNEAQPYYQRILRDYSDQQQLVTSSRNYVPAAASATPPVATALPPAPDPATVALLRQQLSLAETQALFIARSQSAGRATLKDLLQSRLELLRLQRLLPENQSPGKQRALIENELKRMKEVQSAELKKVQVGVIAPGDELPVRLEILSLQRELAAIADGPGTASLATTDAQMTREEAEELARVKNIVKNSPDLIDAAGTTSSSPLISAIMKGYYHVVEYLVNAGVPVSVSSGPIVAAAQSGQLRIVELLLDRGADPNNGAPLLSAAEKGYATTVELLLKRGANVRQTVGEGGVTALHYAAHFSQPTIVGLLLAAGADANALGKLGGRISKPGRSRATLATPLHLAAVRGDTKVIEQLLKASKPDIGNDVGETPLHLAASTGNTNIADRLIAHGANVNRETKYGFTPVTFSVIYGSVAGTELLVAHGADVNKAFITSWMEPNALASTWNPSISPRSLQGRTYLIHVAERPEIMRALLKAQPLLEVTNEQEQTAVQRFADNPELLRLLLEAGASPNPTNQSFPPIVIATVMGAAEAAELLLKHGANPNVPFSRLGNEYSPLSFAELRCRETKAMRFVPPGPTQGPSGDACAVEQLLREHGADPHLLRNRSIAWSRNLTNTFPAFVRGTNDWNRFTLMEAVARSIYQLPFPDLQRSFISRVVDGSSRTIPVDLKAFLQPGQCSNDLRLEWGDIIVVPEADHPINEAKTYLPAENLDTALKCIERNVAMVVKGVTNALLLKLMVPKPGFGWSLPTIRPATLDGKEILTMNVRNFSVREVVIYSNLLRASSDQSRIKVTRPNPNGTPRRWTINLLKELPDDQELWLRDGDVIEVPEKG